METIEHFKIIHLFCLIAQINRKKCNGFSTRVIHFTSSKHRQIHIELYKNKVHFIILSLTKIYNIHKNVLEVIRCVNVSVAHVIFILNNINILSDIFIVYRILIVKRKRSHNPKKKEPINQGLCVNSSFHQS